jgi:drug/metabolite transporter (DMT)-like permease
MIGEVAALAAAMCWAVGSHLFGRIGRGVPAGALNLGKCAAGMALFGATGLLVGGRVVPAMPASAAAWLVASGVIGLSLGDSAYFGAMLHLGVRRALLLLSLAPVFAAVGGALFLGEALGFRDVAAIAAVLAGVVVVVNEQGAPAAPGLALSPRASAVGVLCGLGSALGQATGSLISRRVMASGVSPLDTALVRVLAGLCGMLVLAALYGRLGAWVRLLIRPRLMGSIAGAAFVGTFCGIWLSQVAIGRASSTAVASTLLATSPIFALPLGRWLDAERITARAAAGTLLAVAGLAALTLGKS